MESNIYLTKTIDDIYREIESKTLSGFVEFDPGTESERLKIGIESDLKPTTYTRV